MFDYKKVSLANQVYETIENNILNGIYETDCEISEDGLCRELGVSKMPVREAIDRLMKERLIVENSGKMLVTGITRKDVEDMFEVKRKLEIIATRKAAENIDEEGLNQLHEILEKQIFFAEKGNSDKVRNLDTQFHNVIYRYSGSTVFETILEPLHHKLLKYRKVSLEKEGRIFNSLKEHKAIYDAMAEKDPDKVEKFMLIHIERAFASIMKGQE